VRIQNIVNELNGEKIDVIPWDEHPDKFVANALRPSQVIGVTIVEPEHRAMVMVPDNQLSLAIGKEGQNARLAAKLTGWKIDIRKQSDVEPAVPPAPVPVAVAPVAPTEEEDEPATMAELLDQIPVDPSDEE
jgi:N utilization substance protein A